MMVRALLFGGWCVLVGVSIYAYTQDSVLDQQGEILGALLEKKGSVQFRPESVFLWSNAALEQRFIDGNVIATGSLSRAVIGLTNDRVLEIGPDTQVALSNDELRASGAGQVGQLQGSFVNVLKGQLRLRNAGQDVRARVSEIVKPQSPVARGSERVATLLGFKAREDEGKSVLQVGDRSIAFATGPIDITIEKTVDSVEPTIKLNAGEAKVTQVGSGRVSDLKKGGLVIPEERKKDVGLAAKAASEAISIGDNMPQVAGIGGETLWSFSSLRNQRAENILVGITNPNPQDNVLLALAGSAPSSPRRVLAIKPADFGKSNGRIEVPASVYLKVASREPSADDGALGESYALRLKAGKEVERPDGKVSVFDPQEARLRLRSFADLKDGKFDLLFYKADMSKDAKDAKGAAKGRSAAPGQESFAQLFAGSPWIVQREKPEGADWNLKITVFKKADTQRLRPLFAANEAFDVLEDAPPLPSPTVPGGTQPQRVLRDVLLLRNNKLVARVDSTRPGLEIVREVADLLKAELAFRGREEDFINPRSQAADEMLKATKEGAIYVLKGSEFVPVSAALLSRQPAARRLLLESADGIFKEPVELIGIRNPGNGP